MVTLFKAASIAFSGCFLIGQVCCGTERYVVDASHTSIIFGVSHMGYSYTYGRFNKMSGGYVLDRENPTTSQFHLAIDAASIDTNNAKRDAHLRGPDFLDVKQCPLISFRSTSIKVEQTEHGVFYYLNGDLTIHGMTRKVTLPLQKLGEGQGPGGSYRTGFHCQTTLNRSEYGMTNMIPMIGDEVAITVSFEGIRQDDPAGSTIMQ